eukprot:6209761-Lingulodinium_polyedra.AAC.1
MGFAWSLGAAVAVQVVSVFAAVVPPLARAQFQFPTGGGGCGLQAASIICEPFARLPSDTARP